jgi:hypothetical protein
MDALARMDARQHRPGAAWRITLGLGAFLLLLGVFAPPSAARSTESCGPKPGNPALGAVTQYCPSEVKEAAVKKAAPTPDPETDPSDSSQSVAAAPGGGGSGGDGPAEPAGKTGPEIPLTNYPTSGGVNAVLIALLIAIAIVVAYGAGRARRGSAQAR